MKAIPMDRTRCLARVACVATAILLAAITWPAAARFLPPQSVPVDRIIANMSKKVEENPNDADLLYALGRVHYLAYIYKSASVPGFGSADDFSPAPDWRLHGYRYQQLHKHAEANVLKRWNMAVLSDVPAERRQIFWDEVQAEVQQLSEAKWQPADLDAAKLNAHADLARDYLVRAINATEDKGLAIHTLASLREQQGDRVATAMKDAPAEQIAVKQKELYGQAFDLYRKAFEVSVMNDLAREMMPLSGVSELVSHEAGKRMLAMIHENKVAPDPDTWSNAHSEKVKAAIAKLTELPVRMVTPLIFSMTPHASIDALLAPDTRVTFDLVGDDTPRVWSWIKPGTGILVWDPLHTGRITSGRQLFGATTFWLFWKNGYEALAALDDNADGEIAGDELAGLAVWYDRDSDGTSDAGEVLPIHETEITGLSVQSDRRDGRHPQSTRGLRLRDGRVLPTWDWTTDAVR